MPGGGGTDGGSPEGEKCPGERVFDGETETGYIGSGIVQLTLEKGPGTTFKKCPTHGYV